MMLSLVIPEIKDYIQHLGTIDVPVNKDVITNSTINDTFLQGSKDLAKTRKKMEETNIALLLATIGILAGLFMNPLVLKVLKRIEEVDNNNKEQHNSIYKELKISRTESTTKQSIGEIISHHLEVAPSSISPFIAHEGKRMLDFASGIMNSKFDYTILAAAKIKLDVCKDEARLEIACLPKVFRTKFVKLQDKGVDKLYDDLTAIVTDQVYNSKHNRFRMICEQFIHSHLTGILELNKEIDNCL